MKNNNTSSSLFWWVIALGIVILTASFFVPPASSVVAAPGAAPTPVANILTSNQAAYFRFQPATAIAADTNTGSVNLSQFNSVDLQYIIDQGTTNTTTLTIQWSNDGSNWVNGPALVSNNAADASDITRIPAFGRFARINQDVTNSNPITITLLGLAK